MEISWRELPDNIFAKGIFVRLPGVQQLCIASNCKRYLPDFLVSCNSRPFVIKIAPVEKEGSLGGRLLIRDLYMERMELSTHKLDGFYSQEGLPDERVITYKEPKWMDFGVAFQRDRFRCLEPKHSAGGLIAIRALTVGDDSQECLIICNPLTKRMRCLAPWSYSMCSSFEVTLTVDKSTDSYKVYLSERSAIYIYDSSLHSWSTVDVNVDTSWDNYNPLMEWDQFSWYIASNTVPGKDLFWLLGRVTNNTYARYQPYEGVCFKLSSMPCDLNALVRIGGNVEFPLVINPQQIRLRLGPKGLKNFVGQPRDRNTLVSILEQSGSTNSNSVGVKTMFSVVSKESIHSISDCEDGYICVITNRFHMVCIHEGEDSAGPRFEATTFAVEQTFAAEEQHLPIVFYLPMIFRPSFQSV